MKATFACLLLAGCASVPQLPPCDEITIMVIPTANGNLYAFTETGIQELAGVFKQVQAQKCRIKGEEAES